jgi:hypothetical protein
MSRVRSRFSDRGGRLRLAAVAFWAGLVVLGVVGSSIPSTAATTSFSLGHLRLGGPTGPEDYVFTTGDVVFADGGADTGSYYKAVVSDAAGTVRNPAFPCTSAAAFASRNNTYTVQASDPPSTSTSWTFTLQQWNNATCTGNPTKTASKKFFVAKPTVYADSALTTPKSTFGTSGPAYVTVAGLKPGTNDWTTTWITPSGTTACANTAGDARPDVPSTGVLAGAGGYLQYRPNTTAVGAAWNRESNYETRPCPSFSSANEGAWKLRLGLDGNDFVVLSAFKVDVTDHTPPGNVKGLKRSVGYGILRLSWRKPSDADFDHIGVFVSTTPKTRPRTLVYRGSGRSYTNRRFKNGLYYRYSVVSYDHTGNASRGTGVVVPASILLRAPRDGGIVHGPPRLLWDAIINSTYYNIQLYFGAQKVLSAWPNHARLKLTRSWLYSGSRFQLRNGAYHWYVWPHFGSRSNGRYGQLLGQATFRVR